MEQRFLSNCLKFCGLGPYQPASLNGQMLFKKPKKCGDAALVINMYPHKY